MPSGQRQTDLCPSTRQSAPVPQSQGSLQSLLMHASLVGHSSSRTQPGGFSSCTGLQLRSVTGTQPGRHEQIMVRKGTVSTTLQMAVESQGLSS